MRDSAQIWACLLLLLAGVPVWASAVPESAEDEMKAAVVLGFIRYSEWPALLVDDADIVVGFSGPSSTAATLKRLLEGKTAARRHIRVVEWNPLADPLTYQLVYFADGSDASNKQFLKLTSRRKALLTMGDTADFLDAGGAIRLMLVDGRMSFEFRMDVLAQSGISVSSKLLRFGQMRKTAGHKP